MSPNGTSQTRITTSSAVDTDPDWNPAGTKLAFTTNRDGGYELYAMNANGTSQTRITNNPATDAFPDW